LLPHQPELTFARMKPSEFSERHNQRFTHTVAAPEARMLGNQIFVDNFSCQKKSVDKTQFSPLAGHGCGQAPVATAQSEQNSVQ